MTADPAPRPSTPGGRKFRVPKAAEVIAAEIRRWIGSGVLAEGEPLPSEAELMELFSVSRPTLREAVRVLESESLLEIRRGVGGGTRVRLPKADVAARHASLILQLRGTTMSDVLVARSLLEPTAVRLLAERPRRARAVSQLRRSHEYVLEASDDPFEFARRAAEFHFLLVRLSGNETLTLLDELLQEIIEAQYQLTLKSQSAAERTRVREDTRHEHLEVIDLIEAGDAAAAEASWRHHLDGAANLALDGVAKHQRIERLTSWLPSHMPTD